MSDYRPDPGAAGTHPTAAPKCAATTSTSKDLEALASEVRREHEAAQGAFRNAVEHAIRCGELLIEAKGKVGHGAWGKWISEHFPASDRTARAYMRLARHAEEVNRQGLADLGIEGALKQLASPREPATHPALDVIPPMTDQERERLRASIAEMGCLTPIVYDEDGVLLDGRERWRACRELGIEPPSITYRGLSEIEKAGYVRSMNLIRQDFTPDQIAAIEIKAREQGAGS